jgi:hypothetical protein
MLQKPQSRVKVTVMLEAARAIVRVQYVVSDSENYGHVVTISGREFNINCFKHNHTKSRYDLPTVKNVLC